MSNRITEVRLLSVPLEKDYQHTLWFESASYQESQMKTYTVVDGTFTDFSYQRKDGVIRWPAHFDDISGCNYVMYKNRNKWYYAFITDMKYENDGLTLITIETDVMQTYMFDYQLGQCFIERQHVDDDTIGIHTIPEGLETGEYVCNSARRMPEPSTVNNDYIAYSSDEYRVVLATTVDLSDVNEDSGDKGWRFGAIKDANTYNNLFSGVKYYAFKNRFRDYTVYDVAPGVTSDTSKWDDPNLDDLAWILNKLATISQSDAVVSIFIAPTKLLDIGPKGYITTKEYKYIYASMYVVANNSYSKSFKWNNFARPTSLNTYTPKNKKLLTHPYTYLFVDNNAGGGNIYQYEYFTDEDGGKDDPIYFNVTGGVTPGYSIRLMPYNYKGVSGNNNSEGLTGGKLPICSWQTDVYTNWLTQQGINEKYEFLGHVLGTGSQVGSGAAMGGGYGALAGGIQWTGDGISKIFENVKQREIHKQIPPTLNGNINAGDVNFTNGYGGFTAYQMSIKNEYAQIIDNYFSMYGYQVNTVGVPLSNHRSVYWYTKTSGANVIHKRDGSPIPQVDIDKIRQVYDNGVTFWKSGLYFQRYDIDNPITKPKEA